MRGFSDAYGSWNTIWNRRRIRDSSLPFVLVSDWPSKRTSPAVGGMRSSSIRPVVDLPQPDSPTRPRVSPRLTCERHAGHGGHDPDGAPEHAAADREVLDEVGRDQQRALAVHRRERPWRSATSVTLRRPRCSAVRRSRRPRPARPRRPRARMRVDGDALERLGVVARGPMGVAGDEAQLGHLRVAQARDPGEPAPRVEGAALGGGGSARAATRRSGSSGSSPTSSRRGRLARRPEGVRVARLVEDLLGGAHLHLTAGVHHHHLVGQAGHHAEVVGDEDDRRSRSRP